VTDDISKPVPPLGAGKHPGKMAPPSRITHRRRTKNDKNLIDAVKRYDFEQALKELDNLHLPCSD
jgi:hypothetical protein